MQSVQSRNRLSLILFRSQLGFATCCDHLPGVRRRGPRPVAMNEPNAAISVLPTWQITIASSTFCDRFRAAGVFQASSRPREPFRLKPSPRSAETSTSRPLVSAEAALMNNVYCPVPPSVSTGTLSSSCLSL